MARSRSRQAARRRRATAPGEVADAGHDRQAAPAPSRLAQLVPVLLFGLMLFDRCGPRATQAVGRPSDFQQVSMEMSASALAPEIVTVRANHPVDVTIRNTGVAAHDWAVEGLDQPVHVVVQPGESRGARFTPARAGTYAIIATESGRDEADLVAELVVQ